MSLQTMEFIFLNKRLSCVENKRDKREKKKNLTQRTAWFDLIAINMKEH